MSRKGTWLAVNTAGGFAGMGVLSKRTLRSYINPISNKMMDCILDHFFFSQFIPVLTNVHEDEEKKKSNISRGALVTTFLTEHMRMATSISVSNNTDANTRDNLLRDIVQSICQPLQDNATKYAGFNLICGDMRAAVSELNLYFLPPFFCFALSIGTNKR
jgi:uncharacterized protein with NRDE domain